MFISFQFGLAYQNQTLILFVNSTELKKVSFVILSEVICRSIVTADKITGISLPFIICRIDDAKAWLRMKFDYFFSKD